MRVFCDSGVVVRYFVGDDPARSLAAARLIDGEDTVVVSTAVLLETIHVLRREFQVANPELGTGLIRFLSRADVELLDADQESTIAGIGWSLRHSARRIPDAIIAAAAEYARCDIIATFDESFRSPSVPVRMI
ncbi:MAG: PIN domain-containing protein [Chloroflexota bacterium]